MSLHDELKRLAEGATPGDWTADNFLCDGDHALRIGEPWKHGQPRATIAMVEHNWNDCGPQDRRISWKEAEANAALIVALRNNLPAILSALKERDAMREALVAIKYEAERENGGWVHLKRCIAVQARQALEATNAD